MISRRTVILWPNPRREGRADRASKSSRDDRAAERTMLTREEESTMAIGFSHVGLATHDMESSIEFYEGVLGFRRVAEQRTRVKEGGTVRLTYFDTGDAQFIVFMESKGVKAIPSDFDTGINRSLGVPAGMYHFAFRARSPEDLEERRRTLENAGVVVSETVDHGYAKSIFFRDPNDLQLEFCYQVRPFQESDLHQEPEVSVATD
jgi:catechol 2,3-dioxygenase-like lactoylglutathione lyase family enzyme